MTASYSLHALVDYERLFYVTDLLLILRVGHLFSFRYPLVNTQLLNSLTTESLNWTNIEVRTEYTSSITASCPLLRNVCQYSGNA
jgi:hypothetical protein